MKYIELSGMSADVNAIANDAIDIRYDYCDAKVNLVHVFIAFTRSKCQAAKKLIEKYKIDSKWEKIDILSILYCIWFYYGKIIFNTSNNKRRTRT